MGLFDGFKKELKRVGSTLSASSDGVQPSTPAPRGVESGVQSTGTPRSDLEGMTFAPLMDGAVRVLGGDSKLGAHMFRSTPRTYHLHYSLGVSRYDGKTYLIAGLSSPESDNRLFQDSRFPCYLNLGLLEGLLSSEVYELTVSSVRDTSRSRFTWFNLSDRLLSSFPVLDEFDPLLCQADVRWFGSAIRLAFTYFPNKGRVPDSVTSLSADDFVTVDGAVSLTTDILERFIGAMSRPRLTFDFSALVFLAYLGALPSYGEVSHLFREITSEETNRVSVRMKYLDPNHLGTTPAQYFKVQPYVYSVIGSRPLNLRVSRNVGSKAEVAKSSVEPKSGKKTSSSSDYALGEVYLYKNATPVVLTTKKDGKFEFVLAEAIRPLVNMAISGQTFETDGFRVKNKDVFFKFVNGQPPLYNGHPVAVYLDEASASGLVTTTGKFLDGFKVYFHSNDRSGEVKLTIIK